MRRGLVFRADIRQLELSQKTDGREPVGTLKHFEFRPDGKRRNTEGGFHGLPILEQQEIRPKAQFHVFEDTIAQDSAVQREGLQPAWRRLESEAVFP